MKKSYKYPNCKQIVLGLEESMLITVSAGGSSESVDNFNDNAGGQQGNYEGDLTRRQNSLWDTWTE